MKNIRSISVFILMLLTLQSFGQSTVLKQVIIDPYMSFQNYEHFKRLTLSSPTSGIDHLNEFDFEWGYLYELNVRETKLEEELSDGTRFEYALDYMISRKKVPDSFEFVLHIDPTRYYHEVDSSEQAMNETLIAIDDSTYLYFDEVEIEIPLQLREKFLNLIEKDEPSTGVFSFVDEHRIRLLQFQ